MIGESRRAPGGGRIARLFEAVAGILAALRVLHGGSMRRWGFRAGGNLSNSPQA